MKVLKEYVLVEEVKDSEKKSEGGIILSADKPDYRTPIKSKVLSVGKDVQEVEVGDTVMYMPQTGISVPSEDKENCLWRFIKEEAIIAVL